MTRRPFMVAMIVGTLLRVAALPLPGTRDVGIWKIWTYNATIHRPTTLYGVGGSPPERRVLSYHGAEIVVDYPPLALYELAVVGRAYRFFRPQLVDDVWLTIAIKVPLVLCELGFILLAFAIVRSGIDAAAARWVAAAYWLSPAAIFDASMLGYLDPLFVLPAVASIVAGASAWPFIAGALFAVAVLTKAQALIMAPALAVALWASGERRARGLPFVRAATGGGVTALAIIMPVVSVGAGPNMIGALQSLTRHDLLSGNACNLWWIVGWVLRVRYSFASLGLWPAIVAPARILAISRVVELGYPNPRLVGMVFTTSAVVWAMWTARRARDQMVMFALAAFIVHAYATLSAQVHENHVFPTIPLLAIAAAARPRLRPVFWAMNVIVALNLNLFYGVSEHVDGWAVPRGITVIDLTVWLALINCGVLVWHAARLNRECSTAAASWPCVRKRPER
jgi:hypothetical protein